MEIHINNRVKHVIGVRRILCKKILTSQFLAWGDLTDVGKCLGSKMGGNRTGKHL